jgi:putative sugar O-methyltransferase
MIKGYLMESRKIIKYIKQGLTNPRRGFSFVRRNFLNYYYKKIGLVNTFGKSNISKADSDNYIYNAVINEIIAKPKMFNKFKRDFRYQTVLEHLNFNEGFEIYNHILNNHSENYIFLENAVKNDEVGGAIKYKYKDLSISASSVRYAAVSIEISLLFPDLLKNKDINVIELGCGYGGQAIVLDNNFSLNNYTFIDLPNVLKLIELYVESYFVNFNYNLSTVSAYSNEKFGVINDLFISNYAFSELPYALQVKVLNNMISNCKKGYMRMNSGIGQYRNEFCTKITINELRNRIPYESLLISENPSTADGNYILVWGYSLDNLNKFKLL